MTTSTVVDRGSSGAGSFTADVDAVLAELFVLISPHLTEKQAPPAAWHRGAGVGPRRRRQDGSHQRDGAHLAAGQPVVSVDTKKKELVGADRRHEWHGEWNYSLLPQAA